MTVSIVLDNFNLKIIIINVDIFNFKMMLELKHLTLFRPDFGFPPHRVDFWQIIPEVIFGTFILSSFTRVAESDKIRGHN